MAFCFTTVPVWAVGCGDDSAPATVRDDVGPGTEGGIDTGPVADAAPPVDAAADAEVPVGAPAFIALSLSPRQPLYARSESPRVSAVVFDAVGAEVPGARGPGAVRFDVQPPERATVDAEGRVTFLTEGAGAVRGCIGLVCGRATFFVDDAPPPLALERPRPGAMVVGLPAVIPVVGTADASARVFVNEVEVAVGADGRFATEVPARFGFNRVDVVADDGVRRPPSRSTLDVLYAPEVRVPTATGIDLPGAVQLRLTQALLDAEVAAPVPDEAGAVRVADLASLVTALLARLEPLALVPDRQLAEGAGFSLRIEDLSPGAPEVRLALTPGGLEAFVRFNDLTLVTSGRLDLEGVPVVLDGAVRLTASAYAVLALEAGPDGEPGLRLQAVDVALEQVSGTFADSTAQAVMDTVGSILRAAVEGFARTLVAEVVAEQVPDFIALGLGSALAPLASVPLEVEADPPVPAIALDVGFTLDAPRLRPNDALLLGLSGAVRQRAPVVAPHPLPGVPVEVTDAEPPWPAVGSLALAAQLVTVNALLHAVWAQGALRIDASEVVPENLRALVRSVQLDARLPPVVVAAPPGSAHFFELQLGELDLFLRGARQAEDPDHYVVSLRAGLVLAVGAPGGGPGGQPGGEPDAGPGGGSIRLTIQPEPDLRVVLRAAGGERASFEPEVLATLLTTVLWPEVQEAVGAGLGLDLDAIAVDLADFAAVAPGVSAVTVQPGFPSAPVVRRGWFVLPAAVELGLR